MSTSKLAQHGQLRGQSIKLKLTIASVLIFLLGLLYVCIYPLEPSSGRSLRFDRFIDLPRSGALSALDYIAIREGQLFVSSISSGDVYEVPIGEAGKAKGNPVRSLKGGGSAHGIAISDVNTGFVTRGGRDVADMFDPTTMTATKTVQVPQDPDAAIYDAAEQMIYVASGDAQLATLIDAKTGRFAATINLPGKPEFAALDTRTGLVYQNLTDINAVAAISLKTREVVATWPLTACVGPSGMAIDEAGNRIFIVCSSSRQLVTFDLASHEVIAGVAIGRLSDSVAFDPVLKRIYVAGGAGDFVVISQSPKKRYDVVEHIRTRVGAHTVAVDPKSHQVYLACGGILVAPRLAVFSPDQQAE